MPLTGGFGALLCGLGRAGRGRRCRDPAGQRGAVAHGATVAGRRGGAVRAVPADPPHPVPGRLRDAAPPGCQPPRSRVRRGGRPRDRRVGADPAMIGLAARPALHSAALVNLGWDRPLAWLAAGLVALGVGYGLGMLGLSRRSPRYGTAGPAITQAATLLPRMAVPPAPGTSTPAPASGAATTNGGPDATRGGEFYVFLMPCLNEELVIAGSLQRLLSMPAGNFAAMVIDDGSDDGTAAAVSGVADERVWLLSRKLPNARQGKGEALNDAIAQLVSSGRLAGRDPDDVIIAVVDADGPLDPHALADVTEFFADPAVGAVQIGVRINNRDRSTLARMQDMEFVIYTEVFQRGRRHLGSVGLGGNGQFVRLSALRSLGHAPWTRSLTEDLDLGVRLAAAGWRNEYCRTAAVHQQGVVEVKRLIRQRTRWFQGNLQTWRLIPLVLRSMPGRRGADLLFLLSSPALVLIASLLTPSFCVVLANRNSRS